MNSRHDIASASLKRFRKHVFACVVWTMLASGTAQDLYFGVGGDAIIPVAFEAEGAFGILFQVGGSTNDVISYRGSVGLDVPAVFIGADILYIGSLSTSVLYYLGAGPDFSINYYFTRQKGKGFGFHGVAGIETNPRPFGWFVELQPTYSFTEGLLLKLRAGVNLHVISAKP